MFLVSSEIRSSCIPPFPADYLSFSSPMRSVLFSMSSVLCSRCVSLYETFVFHHLPANLSYQFAVRMFVHAFPVCFFKWNPYVSPWVPNGFPPIPRRAVGDVFFCVSCVFRALSSPYTTPIRSLSMSSRWDPLYLSCTFTMFPQNTRRKCYLSCFSFM